MNPDDPLVTVNCTQYTDSQAAEFSSLCNLHLRMVQENWWTVPFHRDRGYGLSNSHAHGREIGWRDWVIVTTAPLHACFLQIYWFFWPNVINRETKCYPYLMEQKLSCSSDYKINNGSNLQLIDAASRCLHFLASLNDICCHLGIPFLLLIHLRGRWFWLQEFLCFDCGSFFIYKVIDSRINWVIWDRPLNDRINNH